MQGPEEERQSARGRESEEVNDRDTIARGEPLRTRSQRTAGSTRSQDRYRYGPRLSRCRLEPMIHYGSVANEESAFGSDGRGC
jgi:hypothetical protein